MHPLDRPLLLGLVALEQDAVTPGELVEAFRQWRNQPDASLGQILAAQGKLSAERIESLEKIVADSAPADGLASSNSPTTTWRTDSTSVATGNVPTAPLRYVPADTLSATSAIEASKSNRYRPLRLHARGGLGQVFLADDLELHRRVALKEIQAGSADDPWSRRRFVAEAEITGNLEHPGIVPVYGMGVNADGRPFYAMRFIQGETLSAALARFHKNAKPDFASLDFRQLVSRLVSVCNAVAFAHSRGVIHRDIKPQNVMLGPFGETLVVDWGLAKLYAVTQSDETLAWQQQWPSGLVSAERANVTMAGELVGTPAYMSPEQARGDVVGTGPLSDVYGLGAILYALLTGHSPRAGEASDILEAVREGQIAWPRQINPRVPRALSAICKKAMACDAKGRYRTALELAADIERWLADERPDAYSEPWTDTTFRWMRRHRLPVAAASILLAVTSLALAVGYIAVSKQRDIAEAARGEALAANQRAQENAASTRQVIEQYLLRVGDEKFSGVPGFENVRIEMASLAVDRYRDLLKQQTDDMSLVADAGMAMRRSANLYRMVGRNDDAAKLYDESVAQLKNAMSDKAQRPKSEQWLCDTLCDQALLVGRLGGPKAAIAPMREALEIGKRVQDRQPTSVPARQTTARVESDLADLLREIGQFDEAIRLAKSAAATQQEAADENRRPLANRLSASLSTINLGQTLREAGRLPDSEQALNQALTRTSAYLKQSPSEPNLRFLDARCRHELALAHAAAGDAAQAIAELGEAGAALTGLTDDFPKVISFRRKLAQVLTDAAQLELASNNVEQAAQKVKRSIEILEDIESSSTSVMGLLANAQRVAAGAAQQQNDLTAARSYAAQARLNLDRAREVNPDSPKLAEEMKVLNALAASLEP